MARRDHPLYRDTQHEKLAGVCAGIARYFDVDTTLVRVLFIAFTVVGGWPIIVYLLMWWLVDPAPITQPAPPTPLVPPAPAEYPVA